MDVETTTWSPAAGWRHALPEPDGRSALVFLTADPTVAIHGADPIADVWRRWSAHPVVGCSTSGHITDDDPGPGLHGIGMSVAVLRFDRTDVRVSHYDTTRCGGTRRACRRLATDLANASLRGVFLFGDGLTANPSSMLRGVEDILPGVDVAGATASGQPGNADTWTIVGGRAVQGWVSAIGISGDHVMVGHGIGSGWEPSGDEHVITSSYGDTIYSIDGGPALELLRSDRHDDLATLGRRALATSFVVHDLDERAVIRNVIAIDGRTGALRCAGDVVQGGVIQTAHASADALVHGAHVAAKQASFGRERFALACTSVARTAVLGDRAVDEFRDVSDALEPECRLLAFRSTAELSRGDADVDGARNATAAVTTIGER